MPIPRQTKTHPCFAPTCNREVPARMLMCPPHWKRLPRRLQSPVWDHYREGQEINGNPSKEYITAVKAAIKHYEDRQPHNPQPALFEDEGPNEGGPTW